MYVCMYACMYVCMYACMCQSTTLTECTWHVLGWVLEEELWVLTAGRLWPSRAEDGCREAADGPMLIWKKHTHTRHHGKVTTLFDNLVSPQTLKGNPYFSTPGVKQSSH